MASDLLTEIDNWICDIWKKEVSKEYNSNKIAQESVLHSSLYFHLRKKIKRLKRNNRLSVYFNMPFKDSLTKKYNNYPSVDLAVVILEEKSWYPKDLLSVIEIKYYDKHANSEGIQKDMDHLEALRKGIYYPYSDSPTKLRARKAYFLYLVDEGKISFNASLRRKIERLKENRYLKVFLGYGDKGEFITSIENRGG